MRYETENQCQGTDAKPEPAKPRSGEAPGSVNFRVHDAMGNWMIEDRQMGRMIAMTTRERDARFIADALNAYSPNNRTCETVHKQDTP